MTGERLKQTICIHLLKREKRQKYLDTVMGGGGENVSFFPSVMPLYPELIRFHNNIVIASHVNFLTHDAIHKVLNWGGYGNFVEAVGCIEIMDNVFVGSNTTIMYGVRIGENTIVGAHSFVNHDLEGGFVYAGVPVRKICRFQEYFERRKTLQSPGICQSQVITKNEKELLWDYFYENHC